MASGESKGSRRYDKENLLWQSTVAIKSDPVLFVSETPWRRAQFHARIKNLKSVSKSVTCLLRGDMR